MVDAKQLKKFASDICVLLPAAVETLNKACDSLQKTASANKALAERATKAEAAQVSFDSNKLYKAASAVSKLFDSELSPEQLYSVYNTNPNALVDSLYKTASHQVGKLVSGNIGVVRDMGKAQAPSYDSNDASSVYMSIRNKR
jgi:hypothetical protein